MRLSRNIRSARFLALAFAMLVGSMFAKPVAAQPVVPGTGTKLADVGDDFEDAAWSYTLNAPKSSHEQDGQIRHPAGFSKNGRWVEAAKRGQPDEVRRVETPAGGLANSKGSMMFRSLQSGVPGAISRTPHQDDFVASFTKVGSLSTSRSPSVVVRVYLPPYAEWEQRTGNSFGFRASCFGTKDRVYSKKDKKADTYWPGMFLHFYSSKSDAKVKEDYAMLLIRSGERGNDFFGPKLSPGWWTLGMSFTPDGKVHYYAHAGIEDLTEKDFIASQWCYGYKAQNFGSFFFNVVNQDDGKTWSTSWIVDDPAVYVKR